MDKPNKSDRQEEGHAPCRSSRTGRAPLLVCSVDLRTLSGQPPTERQRAETGEYSWVPALFGSAPTVDNRAPIANADGDQSRALSKPTIIALDSSASYDADLDTLTPTWSQTGGPAVTLTDPTTSTIRFTANPVNAATVLRFQLIVSDGKATSSPDEVAITLLPPKPVMGGTQTRSVYLLSLIHISEPTRPY